jgi:hypothetical protein
MRKLNFCLIKITIQLMGSQYIRQYLIVLLFLSPYIITMDYARWRKIHMIVLLTRCLVRTSFRFQH